MKHHKSFLYFFVLLLLCACTSFGCSTNTQSESNRTDKSASSGYNMENNELQEDAAQSVEYFPEDTSLPVPTPSSLYPEFFHEAGQEEVGKIKIYMYDSAADDTKAFLKNYREYLIYLRDETGFSILDASDDVYPAAAYLIHNGDCFVMVSPSKADDNMPLQLTVSFGEGIRQIYERFHGEEKTTSSNSGSLSLSQGKYSIPKDIPAGTYDVEIDSSDQYAISSLYYSKNGNRKGIYAITHDKGYHGMVLEDGDSLEISGDSILLKRSY